jgi:hypothetical protein
VKYIVGLGGSLIKRRRNIMKKVELNHWSIFKSTNGVRLRGFAKNHPQLGDTEVVTSLVDKIYHTKSGQMVAKTANTYYELKF